jgi:RNA polymerase sigma-70 factor (ECF subfamily)
MPETTPTTSNDAQFQRELVALIPHMRAFARSMCGDFSHAEDLAQEAVLKAWQSRGSFTPGTNMKAWTFMILRNQFYSEKRRSWRQQPLDQEVAERTIVASDDPSAALELSDLRHAMQLLPADMREALILIGAGGFSYEEAADILGTVVGTVKSRVSRARDRLAAILYEGLPAGERMAAETAYPEIMAQIDYLVARRQAA